MRLRNIHENVGPATVDYRRIQAEIFRDYLDYDGWQYSFETGVVFRGYKEEWISSEMGVLYTSLNPLQAAEYSPNIAVLNPNVMRTADLLPMVPLTGEEDANEYLIKIEETAAKLAQSNSGFDSAYVFTDTGWMDGPELILFEPQKAELLGHVTVDWDNQRIVVG
jgi:hypothetical protein